MKELQSKIILPSHLQHNKWKEFANVLEEEFNYLYSHIYKRNLKYFIHENNDVDSLITLNKNLGNTGFDLKILESDDPNSDKPTIEEKITYLKKEAESVAFRINAKSSLEYFANVLARSPLTGEYYLLFVNTNNVLFRGVDWNETETKLKKVQDFANNRIPLPIPLYPTADMIKISKRLDSGLQMDTGETLDDTLLPMNISLTNYTALEVTPDSYYTLDTIDYWDTKHILPFLYHNSEYGRGASEVPHIGLAFILYCTIDGVAKTNAFTNIETTLNTTNYASSSTPSKIRLKQGLNEKASYTIENEHINETEDFLLINISFPARLRNEHSNTLPTGDGVSDTFNFTTDQKIVPNSVRIKYTSSGMEYTARDDGNGVLVGAKAEGTVDYLNKTITLYTYVSGQDETYISIPDNGTTINIEYIATEDFDFDNVDIVNDLSSVIIETSAMPLVKVVNEENHLSYFIILDKRS